MTAVAIGLIKTKTLSEENKFSFVCPIFGATTQMAACQKLRDLVWEGRVVEKRKGCQACMIANKCPIDRIVKRVGNKGYEDPYGSLEPKVGALRKDDLERMLPIIVDQRTLERYGASEAEKNLIATANDRIAKAIGSSRVVVASEEIDEVDDERPRRRAKAAKASSAPTPTLNEAAALRGDISAAINVAV